MRGVDVGFEVTMGRGDGDGCDGVTGHGRTGVTVVATNVTGGRECDGRDGRAWM